MVIASTREAEASCGTWPRSSPWSFRSAPSSTWPWTGGTHVDRTSEVGPVSIYRTENKGRLNKRLYLRLGDP